MLAGGSVDVNLDADGIGTDASGTAVLYEPALNYPGDVLFQCAAGLAPCQNGTHDFSGVFSLPAGVGGDFVAAAGCGGDVGESCDSDASHGAWSLVQVVSSQLLLATDAAPQGADFGGAVLQPKARGTAHLVFTATDLGGPGIYQITVAIDGRAVWTGTPNTNGGECVPVGTDPSSGALMFDWQQPCPVTEVVDAPVPTTGLADGAHELTVTVTDAARTSSTVLDQTITTSNPQVTPTSGTPGAVHAQFVISWHWSGKHTLLRKITVRHLPRDARITVHCSGAHCPRLPIRSETAAHADKLLKGLDGRRLTDGDRLQITVTAPHRRAERIELQIRNNRGPRAHLLKH
jgi:hypothetical protein